MQEGIHIALAPEVLFKVAGIPITNTLLTSWVVMFILVAVAIVVGRRLKLIPGKFQTLIEGMFGGVIDYMEETLESRSLAIKFFPLIITLFLFIFTSNVLEFIPGIGSIGLLGNPYAEGFTPLFRSVNTDLNVTLALAIISFLVIEIAGIVAVGFFKYAGKFVNVKSALGFMIGVVELFSEMARLVSFSFRLFGNIFAGEVLILVTAFFVPVLLPVPLMMFELFVGLMQAAIFAILTLFFIKIAVTPVAEH